MNSEDKLAQQTKANLENLRMNVASLLQPALQSVINAFTNILALIGAVVKQFTKLNIFAKKTASSTGQMSKSTSDTLASFDKIDVLKQDTDSGGGSGEVEPIDMTSLMAKYEKIAEEIKKAFEIIFDPFKKAWDNKGSKVIESANKAFEGLKKVVEAVGQSFYKIWTNGTVQETVEHLLGIFEKILSTIGNIEFAFANAWKKDNNGDKIVQNLADAWNNVLTIIEDIADRIEKFTMSKEFQTATNDMVYLWEKLTEWVEKVSVTLKEIWDTELADDFSKLLDSTAKAVDIFKKLYDILEPLLNLLYDNYFTKWLGTVAEAISDIVDAIGSAVDALQYLLEGDFEGAADAIKDAFSSATNASKKVIAITNPVSFATYQATRNEASPAEKIQESISPSSSNGWLAKATGTLGEAEKQEEKINNKRIKNNEKTNKNILSAMKSSFSKMLNYVENGNENILDSEEEVLVVRLKNNKEFNKDLINSTKDTSQELEIETKTLTEKLNNPFNILKNNLQETFNMMKQEIPKTAEEIGQKTATPFENLRDKVEDVFARMKENAKRNMVDTKNNSIENAQETQNKVQTPFERMKNNVSSYIEILKSNASASFNSIKNDSVMKSNETENNVKSPFARMRDTLSTTFSSISTNYRDMWNNISSNSNNPNINNAINAVELFANAIIQGLNKVLEGYRGVRTYITNLPYVGNIGRVILPKLAKGGIVTQATPALIGEAGREAVLPLEQNTEWMDALANKISEGLNVGINFTGSLSQLAQILKPEIDKENRRIGNNLVQGGIA